MYQLAAEQLTRHGVKLLVITPTTDSDEVLISPEIELDHVVLEDPNHSVARLLLGAQEPEAGTLPLPASFLFDAGGKLMHRSTVDDAAGSIESDELHRIIERLG